MEQVNNCFANITPGDQLALGNMISQISSEIAGSAGCPGSCVSKSAGSDLHLQTTDSIDSANKEVKKLFDVGVTPRAQLALGNMVDQISSELKAVDPDTNPLESIFKIASSLVADFQNRPEDISAIMDMFKSQSNLN